MAHQSTSSCVLPIPSQPCVIDLGSLYAAFARLLDLRKARGKRYTLALVLVLFVLAKLCGEDKPYGIAEWVQNRPDGVGGSWLSSLLSDSAYRAIIPTDGCWRWGCRLQICRKPSASS